MYGGQEMNSTHTKEINLLKESSISNYCKTLVFVRVFNQKDFLHELFRLISNIIQNNRRNSIIQQTVEKYPDFIIRAFTSLSILHGSFTTNPSTRSIITDIVGMLNQNLDEIECRYFEYAERSIDTTFFPELYQLWEKIEEVYSFSENPNNLPRTHHLAYTMIVLNRPDLIFDIGNTRQITCVLEELNLNHKTIIGTVESTRETKH